MGQDHVGIRDAKLSEKMQMNVGKSLYYGPPMWSNLDRCYYRTHQNWTPLDKELVRIFHNPTNHAVADVYNHSYLQCPAKGVICHDCDKNRTFQTYVQEAQYFVDEQ